MDHMQPFLINPDATDTIMLPESILHSSQDFVQWQQVGFRDGLPGRLQFKDGIGRTLLDLPLDCANGLYYCPYEMFEAGKGHTVAREMDGVSVPDVSAVSRVRDRCGRQPQPQRRPVHPSRHLELERWATRLGHCGEW